MRPVLTLFLPVVLLVVAVPSFGQFTENATVSGISHMCRSINSMGGGVAVFDLDNDGWEDIYLTGGQDPDQLYRNNGDGTFTLLPDSGGLFLGSLYYTSGVATGDIDNDGYRDILLLTYTNEPNVLIRNNGNGTFTYLPTALSPNTDWSVSASFGDVNNDGLLDLYIVNYVQQDNLLYESGQVVGYAHTCFENLLYINNGDLTFTEAANAYQANNNGCGLATTFTDYDSDGDMDIFVINDFGAWVQPNSVLENTYPIPSFAENGVSSGANQAMYGMGIACGDTDRDGDLDYYITNIGENLLLRNDGEYFSDVTLGSGVGNDSVGGYNTVGWGCTILDYDNDGWPDLYVGNGNISLPPFLQGSENNSDRLFANEGGNQFSDVTASLGLGGFTQSRGVARGDFNNDGLMDIVVCHTASEQGMASSRLYMNTSETTNNWLKVKLQGTVTNRDAFGCQVSVVSNGFHTLQEVDGGSSYASQNSSVRHFGLGTMLYADSVIINFISGAQQVLTNVQANQLLVIVEDAMVTGIDQEPFGFCQDMHGDVIVHGNGDEVLWTVYDCAGRTVIRGQSLIEPTKGAKISLSNHNSLRPGIYLFESRIGHQIQVNKVLVAF